MKTKHWIILLSVIFVVCAAVSVPLLLNTEPASHAEIISEGALIETVDLRIDQEFTVTNSEGGENTITVRDGKIAVTAASCPDHYCMHRGYCSGGAQIVCLPNKLIIRFTGLQEIDVVVG